MARISASDGRSSCDRVVAPPDTVATPGDGDGPRPELAWLALLLLVTPSASELGIWWLSGAKAGLGFELEFGPGRVLAGNRAVLVARSMIGRKVGVRRWFCIIS
jgi:hypothetical protein